MAKAQAAIEMTVLAAIIMLVLFLLFDFGETKLLENASMLQVSQAGNAVNMLAKTAVDVCNEGVGARKRIYLTIPDGVNPSRILIGNNTITLGVYVGSGTTDVSSTVNCPVAKGGFFPTAPGSYWVWVISRQGYVQIGSAVDVEPLNEYFELFPANSTSTNITFSNYGTSPVNISSTLTWSDSEVSASINGTTQRNFSLPSGTSSAPLLNLSITANLNASLGLHTGYITITTNTTESEVISIVVNIVTQSSPSVSYMTISTYNDSGYTLSSASFSALQYIYYIIKTYNSSNNLVNSTVTVKVYNPSSTLLSEQNLPSPTPTGVYSSSYLVPSSAPSGSWQIQAYDVGGASTKTYFTVSTTLPTFSLNSTSSTVAGASILHSLYWQSNLALSGYIFSFDNCTGTLVNSSWVAMSGASNWSNVTKVINSTVGCTIRWCVYANDTLNNWNTTSCSTPFTYLTTTAADTQAPTFSLNSTNSTKAGTPVLHSLYWQDNVALSGYIFQFCNGTWNGANCTASANWANSSCNYRRQLSFITPFGTQNLTNFPVLVVLNSSRINYSSTSATDIRFYDSDNSTLLYKETELWNSTGSSYIWVKKPSLNNNTLDYIWAYYNCSNTNNDNTTNVWNSNYFGVWHMTQVNATDSTTNGMNGTASGGVSQTSGIINGADNFVGSSSGHINTSSSSSWSSTALTISFWVKASSQSSTEAMSDYAHGANMLEAWTTGSNIVFYIYGSSTSYRQAAVNPLDNTWHSYTGVYDGNNLKQDVYIDGVLQDGTLTGTIPATMNNPTSPLDIGCYYTGSVYSGFFTGSLDEIRLSNTARSASWINASYMTESDQLITYGSEQPKGSGWANDTWAAFAGSPATGWSNVTKTITPTLGANVSWCVYANDTSNNWNTTSCTAPFNYITTAS